MLDVNIRAFLGVNNRLAPTSMYDAEKGATYLRSADNVDINLANGVQMRKGFSRVSAALSAGRSIFSHNGNLYFCDGSVLRAGSPVLHAAVASVDPLSDVVFAASALEVFWSDGTTLGAIDATLTSRVANIPRPSVPSVSTIAGSLQPATYCFTMSYSINGVEGAACQTQFHTLSSTGGLRFTLPVSPAEVSYINLYVSGPNGTEPMRFGTVSAGATSVDVTTQTNGRTCATRNKSPMPAGTLLAVHFGRLLSVVGSVLYVSDPFNLGITDSVGGFVRFAEQITTVSPCGSGLFVATTTNTYWITGIGTPDMERRQILNYGAISGAATKLSDSKVAWLSTRGLVIGAEDGSVANIHEKALSLNLSGSGYAVFDKTNNRIITSHA